MLSGQARAEQGARRPKSAKLALNEVLREQMQIPLTEKHSPEQTAQRPESRVPEPAGDVGVARDDLPVAVGAGP
jgi:hypothetical protein